MTPAARQALMADVAALEPQLRHLEADLSGLLLRLDSGSLDAFTTDKRLASIAAKLAASNDDPSAEALALLVDLAAEADAEAA